MESSHSNFIYRNLIVWQKAMQFSCLVYSYVKRFPAEEKYALSDQVRRAVVSIASNIAEGAGRASNKDYAHFLAIARGSLYETMTQLEMAQSFGYIDSLSEIEPAASEISRMLTSLLKKYGAIHSSPTPTPPSNSLPPTPTPPSNSLPPTPTTHSNSLPPTPTPPSNSLPPTPTTHSNSLPPTPTPHSNSFPLPPTPTTHSN